MVHWTSDDRGLPVREVATRDTTLGVHVADLPTRDVAARAGIRFAIDAPDGGVPYEVGVAGGLRPTT